KSVPYDFGIEDAITGCEEAKLGVLGVFLDREAAEVRGDAAAKQKLGRREAVEIDEALLVGREEPEFLLGIVDGGAVGVFQPPGEEVASVAGFGGTLPIFVEDTTSPARGRFEDNL